LGLDILCHLLSDLNNYARLPKYRYAPETVNDVNASRGFMIISPQQAVNSICLNDLSMEIYVKNIFYFHINLFIWFSNMILSDALILPVSHLQTQQVMTSQTRSHSHIEYLIQTYYILLLTL